MEGPASKRFGLEEWVGPSDGEKSSPQERDREDLFPGAQGKEVVLELLVGVLGEAYMDRVRATEV